jgi:5-formyltetrahydrofolate cyclo-ligase
MLAFDIQGQRLGWGGGFYDRTISKLRAQYSVMTVGIAYQNQQVEAVPHTKTDEPLDWIVTDLGVLEITKK